MKPPPYGREFIIARRLAEYVNPWLFAGAPAWELAKRRGPGRLVLPPGEDPHAFDWRCIAGLDVVVRWPEASVPEVDALADLLMAAGATTVNVLADLRYGEVLRAHRRHARAPAEETT